MARRRGEGHSSPADTGNHTHPTAPGFVLGIQGPEELRTEDISFKPRDTFTQKKQQTSLLGPQTENVRGETTKLLKENVEHLHDLGVGNVSSRTHESSDRKGKDWSQGALIRRHKEESGTESPHLGDSPSSTNS